MLELSGRPGFGSPPHGISDDEETRRLLRSRHPDKRWTEPEPRSVVPSPRPKRSEAELRQQSMP